MRSRLVVLVAVALATAAVLGVVEPMMNGLGGDVWAMVWWENDRRVHGLNASGRCPGGLSASRFAGRKRMPEAGRAGGSRGRVRP